MLNDTIFKLEQSHTQDRIFASQLRYRVKQAVNIWLMCTVLVFVAGMKVPGRWQNFIPWVKSSVTPFKSVKWKGEKYPEPRKVARYLDQEYYGEQTLGQWVLWAMGWGLLPVSIIGSGGLWWVRRKEEHETHIRGAQIISTAELGKRLSKAGEPGVKIGGVAIPRELECSHFLICGATGSGKSVTIRQLLRQIAARGETAIVVDPEREFLREFYDPTRGDVVLDPLDDRFPGWSPWDECETSADMEAQSASLFPINPHMGDAARYYREAARITYAQMLEQIIPHDPRLIPDLLAAEAKKKLSERAQSKLSTLQIATASFRYLKQTDRNWSAREWSKERQGWCFLTYRETEKEAVLPFLALALDSMTRRMLASELHPETTTWLVIDELAGLPLIGALPDLMRRSRKRGVAVVLGFQEVSGLESIYGKAVTASMLNAPATRLLLRTNDGETQAWCAGDIGNQDMLRIGESHTVGPENVRDSIHRQSQLLQDRATVLASEFSLLPNLSGYLKVGHYGTARVNLRYTGLVERQPAFIPRENEETTERVAASHNLSATVKVSTERRAI